MSYEYGAKNGLLTKQTYGNNDTVTFTYDILGRVKTETYATHNTPSADNRTLTYTYTGDGQLYRVTDSKTGYTYTYSYDSLGRLTTSTVKDSGGNTLMHTRQVYDANNQLTGQQWTVGDKTYSQTFTYSKTEGNLTNVTLKEGNTTMDSFALSYDALRRLSKVDTSLLDRYYTYRDISSTQTTGQVSSYQYKIGSGNALYSYGYTYDQLGNIATYTENGTTYTYSYDVQSQLLSQAGGGKTYTYIYDSAGNILTTSDGTTTHTYKYGYDDTDGDNLEDDLWKDLLVQFDGKAIKYDLSGNPLEYYNGTDWNFTWQEGRRLITANGGGKALSFTYDSDGLRLTKKVGDTTYNYFYAGGKLMRQTGGGNTLDFFYDESGHPYALKYNGTTYYYVTNLQGDVLKIVYKDEDDTIQVAASYTYDPYGKVLSATGALAEINPLRYRGYYYDVETGFYYLQSRYYDPTICRFINADSYASTGQGILGYNMFAYCGNNPVTGYDPIGLWDWDSFWEGTSLLSIGLLACAVAATVVSGGACTPLIVLAGATFVAGGVTVLNGTAEMIESTTGYNYMRDTVYGGNEQFYETQKEVYAVIAETGTAMLSYVGGSGMNVCFIAGTLVLAADGPQAIETIEKGDFVWAWDEESGDTALKEVVETYIKETDELIHIFVNGEEIITTPTHPFYSPVKGWTDACKLRAGDILVLVNGKYVVVEKVQHEILETPVTVYNFQVKDYHTYYVASGILVHNTCKAARQAQLPTEGKVRYVPPENYNHTLPRTSTGGYIDRFGNVWTKGPSRTAGEAFEWDVQLSRRGQNMLGWLSRDGSHINVSLKGIVTHR